jgi:phosphatidylglycerol---prolipoprotein diacylglyceryl transferase
MFPHISDLINYLFGTHLTFPIQSYGFMLAAAFVLAAFILSRELKRLEKEKKIPACEKNNLTGGPAGLTELVVSGLSGFLIGWKGGGLISDYSTFSNNPQEYILSGKGSLAAGLIISGLLIFLTWYQKNKKRLKEPIITKTIVHPYQLTMNFTIIAAVFGIAGSKVFDTMEHMNDLFRDPVGTIFSFSGLSFYGGLIFAAFAVIWYARLNKIRFPYITDAVAPGLILAYAVGRVGCQLAGDGCWGMINSAPKPAWLTFLPDWIWAFQFPHNVINEGFPIAGCTGEHCFALQYPVFPTSFYETISGLMIFVILWMIRKKLTIPGHLFCIYLIMNGMERYFIEKIRVNRVYSVIGMNMTQAEIIALVIIVLGIAGFWVFRSLEKHHLQKGVYYNKSD